MISVIHIYNDYVTNNNNTLSTLIIYCCLDSFCRLNQLRPPQAALININMISKPLHSQATYPQ